MKDKAVHQFSITRYHGQPNKATTLDGHDVERMEKVFVDEPGWNNFVNVAQYDDHFVYADPSYNLGPWGKGHSKYVCTCGAPGVIIGYQAYKQDNSNVGGLLVCWFHATYGVHATGGQKWV